MNDEIMQIEYPNVYLQIHSRQKVIVTGRTQIRKVAQRITHIMSEADPDWSPVRFTPPRITPPDSPILLTHSQLPQQRRRGRISPDVIDLTEDEHESPRKKQKQKQSSASSITSTTSTKTASTIAQEDEKEESNGPIRYHLVIIEPDWKQYIVLEKDWPNDHKVRDHHIELWKHIQWSKPDIYSPQAIDSYNHNPRYIRLATHFIKEVDILPDLGEYQSDDDDDQDIKMRDYDPDVNQSSTLAQTHHIIDDFDLDLDFEPTQIIQSSTSDNNTQKKK